MLAVSRSVQIHKTVRTGTAWSLVKLVMFRSATLAATLALLQPRRLAMLIRGRSPFMVIGHLPTMCRFQVSSALAREWTTTNSSGPQVMSDHGTQCRLQLPVVSLVNFGDRIYRQDHWVGITRPSHSLLSVVAEWLSLASTLNKSTAREVGESRDFGAAT